MGVDPPVLPPHPAVYLADAHALGLYLRSRGVDYSASPQRVTIYLDVGEAADFVIDAHFIAGQVRFVAVTPLRPLPTQLAEVALVVEHLNHAIGFPVWRALPTLAATFTATLDHEGMLSSRVLEYAVALLREALIRDQPELRRVIGAP